jgi:hypothetical protein
MYVEYKQAPWYGFKDVHIQVSVDVTSGTTNQHATFSAGVKFSVTTTQGHSIHVNCVSPANMVNMNILPVTTVGT